jgi:hypothetical protein
MAVHDEEGAVEANGVPAAKGRNHHSTVAYLVDNSPYLATGILGAWICWQVHWTLALVQLAATVLGPLWIITRVCPNCLLYGRSSCPSGYGLVSARLTSRGDPDRFREVFRLHVTAVAPMWFIPLVAVVIMLVQGADVPWVPLAAFVGIAFVGVPLKARYVTCARCPKRRDCPWGSRTALPRSSPSRRSVRTGAIRRVQ